MLLLPFLGLAETTGSFRLGLVQVAAELGIEPDWLAAVMRIESGFRPDAENPYSNAIGLIQFMPRTAERLGTTVDALAAMTAEEQLAYVLAYYAPFAGKMRSAGDVYMATFYPAAVGKALDTVLFTKSVDVCPPKPKDGYCQNKGLDQDKDGKISVGDVHAVVNGAVASATDRSLRLGMIDVPETGGAPPVAVATAAPRGSKLLAFGVAMSVAYFVVRRFVRA